MESTQVTPTPKRRRRRWLIVALVLVLVIGVPWWYWPRGDARLVGKWRYSSLVVELGPRGWGQITDKRGTTGKIRWWLVRDTLCFDLMSRPPDFKDHVQALQRQISFQFRDSPRETSQI